MAKKKKATARRTATNAKHRIREFDGAGVETQLRMCARDVDAKLRKLEEAKVVKQETMQFEFSV